MDKFEIFCESGGSGCNSLDIQLTSATINNVSIECRSSSDCVNSKFALNSTITDLYFSCYADNSCKSTSFTFGENIDRFHLDCSAAYYWEPCKSLVMDASNTLVNDLFIDCSWCQSMEFTTKVANSAVINCDNSLNGRACQWVDINLEATTVDTTFDITCDNNPDYSDEGACYYGVFTLTGKP